MCMHIAMGCWLNQEVKQGVRLAQSGPEGSVAI